jgi:hypothetical protein
MVRGQRLNQFKLIQKEMMSSSGCLLSTQPDSKGGDNIFVSAELIICKGNGFW